MDGKGIAIAALSVLLIAESALLFHAVKKKPSERTEIVERVIYRTDTVKVLEPHEIIKERMVTDTMLVAVSDTMLVHDTLFLQLPRERRVYEDSTYRAEVSGYRPRLDRIDIYEKEKIVERKVYVNPSRWSFGIQLGYGVTLNSHPILSPYLGVGVTYRFGR